MADIRVDQLDLVSTIADDDQIYFTDVSDTSVAAAGKVKRIEASDAFLLPSSTQSMSNKTFEDSTTTFYDNASATKKMRFEVSGVTAGQTRVLTAPNYDGTIATLAGTETFTNKTFTSPVVQTWGGWEAAAVTWTRTGNHTFTISGAGDLSALYSKGTWVRYRDGGADEYGIVLSSSYSNPTLTVNLVPNADYAMASATITNNYISHMATPTGFTGNWLLNTKAKAYLFAAQSTVSGSFVKVNLNTEVYDLGADFDNATNYRFTAPISGYYNIKGALRYADLAAGNYPFIAIYKDGAAIAYSSMPVHATNEDPRLIVTTTEYLTNGQYIELYGFHAFGSNRDVSGGASETWMTVELIGI